jgi:phosphatidylserine decarboxylase
MDKEEALAIFEKIFQEIRENKLFGKKIRKHDFNLLAFILNNIRNYENPRTDFIPINYKTFDDWFLRKLSPNKLKECLETARPCKICCPVQGKIREKISFGNITLKKSFIDIQRLLSITNGHQMIQISLLKGDYHHVHSPVDGVIHKVICYERGEFFNENGQISDALTSIQILSEYGIITLLCLGEQTVQSFITIIKVGQYISKVDELGYFYFGSQVILVLPKPLQLCVINVKRVFVGDCLCDNL